tara:strand:- start:1029 stop:1478 length:450 start_codon:yes stop_codon:yes gene_type:complete
MQQHKNNLDEVFEINALTIDELRVIFQIIANPHKFNNRNQVAEACKVSNKDNIYLVFDKFNFLIKKNEGYYIDLGELENYLGKIYSKEKKEVLMNLLRNEWVSIQINNNMDLLLELFKPNKNQQILQYIFRKIEYNNSDVENLKKQLNL